MRISDWSSDVCSSDLAVAGPRERDLLDVSGDRGGVAGLVGHRDVADAGGPADRVERARAGELSQYPGLAPQDRKSVVQGKSVSVRVDLGGRRILTKKNPRIDAHQPHNTHTKQR